MYCATSIGSEPPIIFDKEREFLCLDGNVRAYTNEQLTQLSKQRLADMHFLLASLFKETLPGKRDRQLLEQGVKVVKKQLASWPVTIRGNIFINCTCLFTPKIEIETTLFEPLLENSSSLFPQPIGVYYTTTADQQIHPHGVLLPKGSTIRILQDINCLTYVGREQAINLRTVFEQKPCLLKVLQAKISIAEGEYRETKLTIFLLTGKIFIMFPIFELKGVIDATGEAHLENGMNFTFDDFVSSPGFFVERNLISSPTFTICKAIEG